MAKQQIPFFVPLSVSLSSGAEGSFQYQNSSNRRFVIERIHQKATGDFDIIDWSNNSSDQFSPASNSNPMDGESLPSMDKDTDIPANLPIPLTLEGQEIVKWTLLNKTATTNVVRFTLSGYLELG